MQRRLLGFYTTDAMVAERPKKGNAAPGMPGGGMDGMEY